MPIPALNVTAVVLLASFAAGLSPELRINKAATGWDTVNISPTTVLSLDYRGQFRVHVFKNTLPGESAQYYYSPALVFDPDSVKCAFNPTKKTNEVTFSVIMWNTEYETFVQDSVARYENKSYITATNIRVLPIEEIRIATVDGSNSEFELINRWESYASKPSRFTFWLRCSAFQVCNTTAQDLRDHPESFLRDLLVSYSLTAQNRVWRTIQITADHLRSGDRFNKLQQQLPGKDVVYVTLDYVSKIAQEIASNIIAQQETNDEFASQDQSVTLASLLEKALQQRSVSSSTFDGRMWESVFWEEENSRPDRVTNKLNERYFKSDDEMKLIIKEALSTGRNPCTSTRTSFGIAPPTFGAQIAACNAASFASHSDKEDFVFTMEEALSKSQWNGERFQPKALKLGLVNVTKLAQSTTLVSALVRVTKTTAELTSKINLLPSFTVTPQFDVQDSVQCDDSLFLISEEKVDYSNAMKLCEDSGGRLGIFRTQRTWECVKAKLQTVPRPEYGYWFGLSAVPQIPHSWVWSDGRRVRPNDFSYWLPGQPNLGSPGLYTCASTYPERSPTDYLTWAAIECPYSEQFISQVPFQQDVKR